MDLSVYQTQTATGNGEAARKGNNGSATGVSFMDLIFARMIAATPEIGDGTNGKAAQDEPALQTAPDYEGHTEPLQWLDALSAEDSADIVTTDMPDTAHITDANGRAEHAAAERALMKQIAHLLQGIPAEHRPVLHPVKPADLKTTDIEPADMSAEPALIASGLTLEELTSMLEELMNSDGQDQAFMIGVQIMPPDSRKDAIVLPRAIIMPQTADTTNKAGKTGKADGGTPSPLQMSMPPGTAALSDGENLESTLNAMIGDGEDGLEPGLRRRNAGGFDKILRVLEAAQQKTGAGAGTATERPTHAMSAGNSTIPAPAQPQQNGLSQLLGSAAWESIFPEGLDWASPMTGQPQPGSAQAAQLTSLVSHAGHASQAHPATQMVAASISKAAQGGDSKVMTLKLDPPELGRINVRLEFAQDGKSLKTLIIAEKPETYMMLQRDAHVLERALQGNGLDVSEDGGLNFELAQDGSLFDQNPDGRGQNAGGGSGGRGEGGEDEVIIETAMDWTVDPDTGLMHYNVLA